MLIGENHYIKSEDKMFENLEKYTPSEIWSDMMYMSSIGNIDQYKHYDTRNYINIDDKGNFYWYDGKKEKYYHVKKDAALRALQL